MSAPFDPSKDQAALDATAAMFKGGTRDTTIVQSPPSSGGGLMADVSHYANPLNVLQKLGDAFSFVRNKTVLPVEGFLDLHGLADQSSLPGLSHLGGLTPAQDAQLADVYKKTGSFTAVAKAREAMLHGALGTIEKFAWQTATDPLVLAGLGIPGKLGLGATALSRGLTGADEAGPIASRIAQGLGAANVLDTKAAELQALPFKVAGKTVKLAGDLTGLSGPVSKAFEISKGAAEDMLQRSAVSFLNRPVDVIRNLLGQGGESTTRFITHTMDDLMQGGLTADGSLNQAAQAARIAKIEQLNPYDLTSLYRHVEAILSVVPPVQQDPLMRATLNDVRDNLTKRGAIDAATNELTPFASAHSQMEDELRGQGITSAPDRIRYHSLLDQAAEVLPKVGGQDNVFKKADDVYNLFNSRFLLPNATKTGEKIITDEKLKTLPIEQQEKLIQGNGAKVNGAPPTAAELLPEILKRTAGGSKLTEVINNREVLKTGTLMSAYGIDRDTASALMQELEGAGVLGPMHSKSGIATVIGIADSDPLLAQAKSILKLTQTRGIIAQKAELASEMNLSADAASRLWERAKGTTSAPSIVTNGAATVAAPATAPAVMTDADRTLLRQWATYTKAVAIPPAVTPDILAAAQRAGLGLQPGDTPETFLERISQATNGTSPVGASTAPSANGNATQVVAPTNGASAAPAASGGLSDTYEQTLRTLFNPDGSLKSWGSTAGAFKDILGHAVMVNMTDAQKARLLHAIGETTWDDTSQEKIAQALQNFAQTASPNDLKLQLLFHDVQELSQGGARANGTLDAQGMQNYLDVLGGRPNVVPSWPLQATPDAFTHVASDRLSELQHGASVDQVLGRVAIHAGLPPEAMAGVSKALTPILTSNKSWTDNLLIMDRPDVQVQLVQAALHPERQKFYVSETMRLLNDEMGQYGGRWPWLLNVLRAGDLGPKLAEAPVSQAFGRAGDQTLLTNTQAPLWKKILARPGVADAVSQAYQDFDRIDALLFQIKAQQPLFRLPANPTANTVLGAIQDGWVTKAEQEELTSLLEKWGMPTDQGVTELSHKMLRNLPYNLRSQRLSDSVLEAMDKSRPNLFTSKNKFELVPDENGKAKMVPVTSDHPQWMRAYKWITTAWREQALLSVAFMMTHGSAVVVRAALHGINPFISQDGAFTLARDLGNNVAPSIFRNTGTSAYEIAGRDSAFRAAPGIGRPLGWLSEGSRAIINWIDSSGRMAVWAHGARDMFTTQFQPRFVEEAGRMLTADGVEAGAVRAFKQNAAKAYLGAAPEDIFKEATKAGASPTLASELSSIWQRGQIEASAHGEQLALKIHLDFLDKRNIESALHLNDILPFHTWATRNIPFYLQTAIENPWLLRVWYHYRQATQDEADSLGLPKSFADKLQIPTPFNGIMQALFGPGQHFFNPMALMSITSQFRQPYIPTDAPWTAQVLGLLSSAGVRPAPWIDLPLHAVGFYGNAEPPPTWHQGNLFAALTHTDLQPGVQLTSAIRNFLHPGHPVHTIANSQLQDYLINKQIKLLALQETGNPSNPFYTAAMTDPTSAIYQRAKDVVRNDELGRSLYSFLLPFPQAQMSNEELAIRSTSPSKQLDTGAVPTKTLYAQQDPITALMGVPDSQEKSQLEAGLGLVGATGNPVIKQLLEQAAVSRWPRYAEYLAWVKTQPPGADVSVALFNRTH